MQQTIRENVMAEFTKLAAIPRKSGHEKAVSDFLYKWAQERNLAVVQDEVNNIIIDKPAAPGCENKPLTIIQGHMDMVCVAKPGYDYNPLGDAIKLVQEGDFLMAEGTSLGADDGIGVAMVMYLLQAEFAHGPLRVLITVDEENGMTGAKALDAKYLDAAYLINCDSEDYDVITVSSAGGFNIDLKRSVVWQKPTVTDAYKIAIRGLQGGHSGVEIHKGRANAIKLMGVMLHFMREAEIRFELVSINGGHARNVIPSYAECNVLIGVMDTYRLNNVIAKMNEYVAALYKTTEPAYYIDFAPTERASKVMDKSSAEAIIDYLFIVSNGVLKMSSAEAGVVETSSNLGVITTGDNHVAIQVYPRSNVNIMLDEIEAYQKKLAGFTGMSASFSAKAPGWPVSPSSKLADLMAAVFAEQNNCPIKVETIHAGLECSWFYAKNPQLEMVSIGPTVTGVHSPQEKLDLRTIEPSVKMLMATLERLV